MGIRIIKTDRRADMKKALQITIQVIMVLILLKGFLMNSLYSQEIEQDSSKTEIFELDQGCKLILKKKIDITDNASEEIVGSKLLLMML